MIDVFVHVGRHPQTSKRNAAQHLLAALGVRDLRMELHAVDPALAVLERGDRRARRAGGDGEARRRGRDRVTVAHPHDLLGREVGEDDRSGIGAGHRRAPVLAATRPAHLAAELLREELRAVADAEHGDADVVDVGVDRSAPSSTCTDAGPPENTMPRGRFASISSSGIVRGTISE